MAYSAAATVLALAIAVAILVLLQGLWTYLPRQVKAEKRLVLLPTIWVLFKVLVVGFPIAETLL